MSTSSRKRSPGSRSILNEILNYVKEAPLLFELCDINNLLDELLYLLASDKSWAHIKIIKKYDPHLPFALCDVQQIKQVFINILMNSFEAMHGKGTITIEHGTDDLRRETVPCHID